MEYISRNDAFELLKKYNKDPFHIQHALTVEAVMKWYANELGYGACMVMSYNKNVFREVLELPEDYETRAVIVLGEAKDIVKLIDLKDENDTKYFIENGIHYVPKLSLDKILL